MAFKGKAWRRQYIKGNPHPFGMKAFVLADSETGYLHGVRLYFGSETDILSDLNLLQTCRVVLTVTQPLERLHHVITDRFYLSPELSSKLEGTGFHWHRASQRSRVGGNRVVGQSEGIYRSGKMMALQWQDKRPITMLNPAIWSRSRRGEDG